MTKGVIAGFNFIDDFKPMKYWSFPSSYDMKKKQTQLNQMLYSGEYVAAEKKDGYFERIIKDEDGNIFMLPKNKGVNGWVDKHEWLPHIQDFFDSLPNGTCLIGEVYRPGETSKGITTVLGCLKEKAINRQKDDKNKLILYVFDVLAYEQAATYHLPMGKRVEKLKSIELKHSGNKFVEFAKYYNDPDIIHKEWLKILGQGGEGVVMTRADYPYEFNKRTVRKTLKLKKELEESIDVFLTGRYKKATYLYTGKEVKNWQYWYSQITGEYFIGTMDEKVDIEKFDPVTKAWFYGWAGSIEIALIKDNKIVPIGWISNVTDEVKHGIVEDNNRYIGRVAELQATEIDRSDEIPSLRHARIIGWRNDKDYLDCEWGQIE